MLPANLPLCRPEPGWSSGRNTGQLHTRTDDRGPGKNVHGARSVLISERKLVLITVVA